MKTIQSRMPMFFLMGLVLLLLSACQENTAEEMHSHLEEAVETEEVFEQQQQPLLEAEQREQEIYEEIIDLGLDEMDEIEALAEEALELVDERQERLETERESLHASYEEYEKAIELKDDLEDEEAYAEAETMEEAMEARVAAYEEMYGHYEEALELDSELYEMFQNEDLTIETLSDHIEEINEVYRSIIDAKDDFNTYTDEYNEAKNQFYETSGLEVTQDAAETEVEEPNEEEDSE